ncbi:MAG: hypothetical protein IT444_07130 [Phycisphaeraceae bacterium]|nr:hypothetical protein [Phycisphaeraceae bacterium]
MRTKFPRFSLLLLTLIFPLLNGNVFADTSKTEAAETLDSAVFLLKESMMVTRDGRHNDLLRALRQLADPELEPFFSELSQSEHPTLKIHGLLGLAECSENKELDLVRVSDIKNPALQAEVISAAMDSEILSDEQAKKLVEWPGLDNGVKVVVAQQLVQKKLISNTDFLQEAAKSDNIGRKGMALLLLTQLGDTNAANELMNIDSSTDSRRDAVREMLLQAALRYEYDRIAPWAMRVANEPNVGAKLGLIALRTAMRFKSPGADDLWRRQFQSTDSAAQKVRLAVIALQLSTWIDASVFNTLTTSDDVLIKQMGLVGRAIASKQSVVEPTIALIKLGHSLSNIWIISHLRRFASKEDALAILPAIVQAAGPEPARGRAERLDEAVMATRLLVELDTPAAVKALRPILEDPHTDSVLAQVILVGLVRSDKGTPADVIAGLPPFSDLNTNNLALVVLAKGGAKLTPDQLQGLSLVVRGGGIRQDSVRLQAAWTYLKITKQTRTALASIKS